LTERKGGIKNRDAKGRHVHDTGTTTIHRRGEGRNSFLARVELGVSRQITIGGWENFEGFGHTCIRKQIQSGKGGYCRKDVKTGKEAVPHGMLTGKGLTCGESGREKTAVKQRSLKRVRMKKQAEKKKIRTSKVLQPSNGLNFVIKENLKRKKTGCINKNGGEPGDRGGYSGV